MKTKIFNNSLQLKSTSIEGEFSGYASIFNIIDEYGDIILPGAFRNSLAENLQIKFLWQHDPKEPIGLFKVVKETVNGLYVEGRLLLELMKAKEAYLLMKEGIITGLSIGFEVTDSYYAEGARYITSLKLWEISLVTFPANPQAHLTEVKSDLADLKMALNSAVNVIGAVNSY